MPSAVIGENTLSAKFRETFDKLAKQGKIGVRGRSSYYSLKDTLAECMLDNNVDVESAMRHLRQKDLTTFQRYVKRLGLGE